MASSLHGGSCHVLYLDLAVGSCSCPYLDFDSLLLSLLLSFLLSLSLLLYHEGQTVRTLEKRLLRKAGRRNDRAHESFEVWIEALTSS